VNILTIATLIAAVLAGGPAPRPHIDDPRNTAVWAVAEVIGTAAGYTAPLRLYEPSRRGQRRLVYVGTVWGGTECSLGTWWRAATRSWDPLRWECP
jgi:hypothetical protein